MTVLILKSVSRSILSVHREKVFGTKEGDFSISHLNTPRHCYQGIKMVTVVTPMTCKNWKKIENDVLYEFLFNRIH